jgi:hypothetical protein
MTVVSSVRDPEGTLYSHRDWLKTSIPGAPPLNCIVDIRQFFSGTFQTRLNKLINPVKVRPVYIFSIGANSDIGCFDHHPG